MKTLMRQCRATAGKRQTDRLRSGGAGKNTTTTSPLRAPAVSPFRYSISKAGYTGGTAASLPIVGFVVLQMAFVFLALSKFIFNGKAIDE